MVLLKIAFEDGAINPLIPTFPAFFVFMVVTFIPFTCFGFPDTSPMLASLTEVSLVTGSRSPDVVAFTVKAASFVLSTVAVTIHKDFSSKAMSVVRLKVAFVDALVFNFKIAAALSSAFSPLSIIKQF